MITFYLRIQNLTNNYLGRRENYSLRSTSLDGLFVENVLRESQVIWNSFIWVGLNLKYQILVLY